jgi:hypothetical protein
MTLCQNHHLDERSLMKISSKSLRVVETFDSQKSFTTRSEACTATPAVAGRNIERNLHGNAVKQ